MLKIRRLAPFDYNQIRKMIEYVQPGIVSNIFHESKFTLFPVDVLHNLLPLEMRFLPESYVAVEGSKAVVSP